MSARKAGGGLLAVVLPLLLFVPRARAQGGGATGVGPDLGMGGVGYAWTWTGSSRYYGRTARGPAVRLGWQFGDGLYLVGRARRLDFTGTGGRFEAAELGVGYIADPTKRAAAYVEADFVRASLSGLPPTLGDHEYYWRFVYGIRQDLGGPFVLGLRLDGELNQRWAPHGLGERLSLAAGFAPVTVGVAWQHDIDVNAEVAFIRLGF